MTAAPPAVDDRTFADLLQAARLRIPRYCPEWTDFNPSDPGTALVELFAWFTELMLVRLNTVPERSHRELLRLVNLQPRPARPAAAHVVLTMTEGRPPAAVPARARFDVPGPDGALAFEAVAGVDLVPYPLDAVRVWDGGRDTDLTAANERTDGSFRPLGWSPQPGNALYLGFKPPQDAAARPTFPTTFTVRFFDPARPEADPRPTTGRPQPPAVTLVWEYQSANDLPAGTTTTGVAAADALDRWRRLAVREDGTANLSQEGTMRVTGPGPDILATRPVGPPDDPPRYWLRLRLAGGEYPPDRVPTVGFVRANVVAVENRRTVRDEVLGDSDGTSPPDGFPLRNRPADPDTLVIEVQPPDGDGPGNEWERKDDLYGSGRDDRHYTLDPTAGVVRFGDGTRGLVPPPGWVVLAREYRAGGGAAGNVAAGAIDAPPAGVSGIDRVTNPRPATGGADTETDAELADRAPQVLRGAGRAVAVTADDYRRLAEAVPGVAKAAVLERRHPDFPGWDVPGTLTVAVVPDDAPPAADGEPVAPRLTQAMLDAVAAELNRARTVGTEVHVAPARYVRLMVTAEVVAAVGATEAEARDAAQRAVEEYLAPVHPPAVRRRGKPAPRYPHGWPFDTPFQPTRLYEVILAATDETGTVRPVQAVTSLRLTVDGNDCPLGNELKFEADQLPVTAAVVTTPPARGTRR